MKKILFFIALALWAGVTVSAATQYAGGDGLYAIIAGARGENGAIAILQDIESFSFTTDFGSVGNSGSVGYYIYTDDPANAVDGGTLFSKKNGGAIDLGALSEGQNIGFYLVRNNGDIITDFAFVTEGDELSLKFFKQGNGKDEMFVLDNITILQSESSGSPSGQPLPGALAVLLLGGGALALRQRRKA